MKKIATLIFLIASSAASAKPVILDCSYTNSELEKKVIRINMDTENETASASTGEGLPYIGKLVSDGAHYWFTGGNQGQALDLSETYTIDRNDLSFNIYVHVMKATFPGQCKIVKERKPKI